MTLKEMRKKHKLSQLKAAALASEKVNMTLSKWSIIENLDLDFIKALEEVFGEELEIPAGVKHG